MSLLKTLAFSIITLYIVVVIIFYILQTRLIFYPGKLSEGFRFDPEGHGEEIFLKTADGERISALYFQGTKPEVILYFHGNAGNLSGWQFVAEDFTQPGYSVFIIDYRGYGKSSGEISEQGFYNDADAAYNFLVHDKKVPAGNIIVYGRSIGSGVAVELASKHPVRGLVLEAPYASLPALANEKLPLFFPSLYLKYKFDNIRKINSVKSPVIFIHGTTDTLIPPSHSERLFKTFKGKKEIIIVAGGSHNDLNAYPEYQKFLSERLSRFFSS
jgi:uncharacterized protein